MAAHGAPAAHGPPRPAAPLPPEGFPSRLAALALELCAIPSPTGEERQLVDALADRAQGHGWPLQRFGNALYVAGAPPPAPPLALVGHLDTVPAFPGDGLTRREGGRLYGKGASDMKGGVALAWTLYQDLPVARRPHLLLYDREEGPNADNGLEPLLQAVELPPLDLAICLEPTDNRLQLGCVGSLHATVRFAGQAAHSARPWEGANAVHAAGPLLVKLLTAPPRPVVRDGLTFYEVAQVTQAKGGRARNVVPDRFELNLNYRFAPGVSLDRAKADLAALVGPGPELTFTDLSPSGNTGADSPELRRLQDLGLRLEAKQAWTDVARLQAYGHRAVNFGPGQTAQAHQVDEWCEVAALETAYHTLWRWLTGPR